MAVKPKDSKLTFKNKKAYHNYFIHDTYEAGLALKGSEVKAIRAGRVNIKDSFVRIIKAEVFIFNMHITHLDTAHATYRPDENRDRKLLLHKKEIEKLFEKVSKDGMTIVPIKMYFNKRNILKMQIATGEGKKLYDKRNDLKQRTMQRETQMALKNWK
ncbi:SsrA-binding protein SmpB [Arcobacter sp. HD9-500m-PIT-SAG03]|nr:SsrA-binding protein SmpB [Arcobacter sp. HD9-500m-PIT-SAG03]